MQQQCCLVVWSLLPVLHYQDNAVVQLLPPPPSVSLTTTVDGALRFYPTRNVHNITDVFPLVSD